MIKLTVDDEHVHQEVHGTAIDIAIDAVRAITAIYRSIERRDALGAAVFRSSATALIGDSSPVWDTSRVSKCVSVDMVPGADEVIKRVLEGGGSMTEIDLTRDQCAALADFLRRTVDRGMDSGYDEIELLVLAQRALRNAAKPTVRVPLCDVPKSGTPEGGGCGERCA